MVMNFNFLWHKSFLVMEIKSLHCHPLSAGLTGAAETAVVCLWALGAELGALRRSASALAASL